MIYECKTKHSNKFGLETEILWVKHELYVFLNYNFIET